MFQKILVPLDGTELAEGILPYVSQLAIGLDIPMVLISVIDPDSFEMPYGLRGSGGDPLVEHFENTGWDVYSPDFGWAGFAPEGTGAPGPVVERGKPHATQIFERAREEAMRSLEAVVKRLDEKSIKATGTVSFGKAAEEIIRVAEREGCDLIAFMLIDELKLLRSLT